MVNLTDDEKLELGIYIEQVIREELQKIIKQEARDISQKIESRVDLETNINTLTNRILAQSKIKGFVESISKTMETYLRDLDDIEQFRDNIRREIIQSLAEDKENLIKKATEKTDAMIEGQKEIIKGYAHEAYELADFIENTKKRVINEIVSEATKRIEIEDVRPRAIEIYHNGTLEKTLEKELYHQEFETIYKLIRIGLPVMLIGPTGSGKSVCAGQVAKALDMPMYYTNNASEEYKLLGFTDAHGKYKETQFYKAFKYGGLFFLDEIDNSHPSALLSLNSAIGATTNGNIYMAFEDGKYTHAHPNFRIIAAANTWGNGANRMYCGRSELDSASLDRFIQIYFDYDSKIEKSIISDDELLQFFWNFRRIISDCGIRHTVTTRNIDYASKLKEAGFTTEQILLYTIIKELDFEDMKIISQRFDDEGIEPSIYSEGFKKMVLKKA